MSIAASDMVTLSGGWSSREFERAPREGDQLFWKRKSANGHGWACTTSGPGLSVFHDDTLHLVVRGYAEWRGTTVEPLAAAFAQHYRASQELPLAELEGSFSLTLIDAERQRVLLFRNLMGANNTFYAVTSAGFEFANNLAHLTRSLPERKVNSAIVPIFFRYRSIPGRDTMLEGVFRLMPGEWVEFRDGQLARRQIGTLARLISQPIPVSEAVDRVDAVLGEVIDSYARQDGQAVNLLSGGVDSCYLQALWNRSSAATARHSLAAVVDHPFTRGDTEYSRSAASYFQTAHREYLTSEPYAKYLVESLDATGEFPNHVQSAYFAALAREIRAHGQQSGLCGEGADSLFGTPAAFQMRRAEQLERLIPVAPLRALAARLAGALGKPDFADCLRLAGHTRDIADLAHPANQMAVFASEAPMEQCFGREALREAAAYRRQLLTQYEAGSDPIELTHASGYLGEAMQTAALWASYFETEGVQLYCPLLDSRLLKLALNLPGADRYSGREAKWIIKEALARHAPERYAYRSKRGFGQPIFEWMGEGGALKSQVAAIGNYPFLNAAALRAAKAEPNWFLYSLLCFDLWHKLFIEQRDAASLWA